MSTRTRADWSQESGTQPQSAPPSDQHDPRFSGQMPRGEIDAQSRKGSPAHRNNFSPLVNTTPQQKVPLPTTFPGVGQFPARDPWKEEKEEFLGSPVAHPEPCTVHLPHDHVYRDCACLLGRPHTKEVGMPRLLGTPPPSSEQVFKRIWVMVGCSGWESCHVVVSPVPETEVRKGPTLINVDQTYLPSNSVSLSSLRLQDIQFACGSGRFLHTDRLTCLCLGLCEDSHPPWLSGCLPMRHAVK